MGKVILKSILDNEDDIIKFTILIQKMVAKHFKEEFQNRDITSMEAKQIIENIIYNPKNKNKSLEYIKGLINLKFIEVLGL